MKSIEDFIKLLTLKRYSVNTINSYQSHLRLTKLHFKEREFGDLTDKELFEFIYFLVNVKNISASYQRQIVGALKLF